MPLKLSIMAAVSLSIAGPFRGVLPRIAPKRANQPRKNPLSFEPLNRIRWSTSIDFRNSGAGAHYGAPVITSSNTVVIAVKTTNGFQVSAFEGPSGKLKYTLATDYLLPSYGWVPVCQPVLAQSTE